MKDKIINFLLIFLLVFLTMNLFFWEKKDSQTLTGIQVTNNKSYSVPANVQISIANNTWDELVFDTCRDIQIKKDENSIVADECREISLASGEKTDVSFEKQHQKFESIWNYFVKFTPPWVENEILSQFEVQHKGFFSKFFIFFFYAPVYNLMALLLEVTNYSLGWAIIIITILIRLLLLYPQHKMMVSQRKLQLIQPKIKEIQEKHKGNPQVLGMELMQLYKQEKVNPMGSCGMLLIQMPILIVIYQVIISIQDYANTYYLYGFMGEYNMDLIHTNFYWVDLLAVGWLNGLILAIIVAGLQYVQVKLSLAYNKSDVKKSWVVLEKKKDAKDYNSFMPDPDLLNKFMLYGLPVMIWIFTFTFFAWVWVYWWVWTIFMILQQYFVNKILKK